MNDKLNKKQADALKEAVVSQPEYRNSSIRTNGSGGMMHRKMTLILKLHTSLQRTRRVLYGLYFDRAFHRNHVFEKERLPFNLYGNNLLERIKAQQVDAVMPNDCFIRCGGEPLMSRVQAGRDMLLKTCR